MLTDCTEIHSLIFWLQLLHGEGPAVSHRFGGRVLALVESSKVMLFPPHGGEDDELHGFSRQLSVPVHLDIATTLCVIALYGGILALPLHQDGNLVDVAARDCTREPAKRH